MRTMAVVFSLGLSGVACTSEPQARRMLETPGAEVAGSTLDAGMKLDADDAPPDARSADAPFDVSIGVGDAAEDASSTGGTPPNPPPTKPPPPATTALRIAAFGDYGADVSSEEGQVADLVHAWAPDHVLTLGDNNYESGEASTIDANIGKYYQAFIGAYRGSYG